jgi:hypothetical protein
MSISRNTTSPRRPSSQILLGQYKKKEPALWQTGEGRIPLIEPTHYKKKTAELKSVKRPFFCKENC